LEAVVDVVVHGLRILDLNATLVRKVFNGEPHDHALASRFGVYLGLLVARPERVKND
jgi:hypothetical protein